jgi:hypothetical protein
MAVLQVDVEDLAARLQKRMRGRPKKKKEKLPSIAPPAWRRAASEIEHSDLQTLVDRQLVLAEWMQSSLREEIRRKMSASDPKLTMDDVRRFETMTQALHRCFQTLKGADDLAEEMQKRMTGQQILEAALKKIEAQEPQTVKWAIKRLKAHMELATPKAAPQSKSVAALAELNDD